MSCLSTGRYVVESFTHGLEETPIAQMWRAGEVLGAKGQPDDLELTNEFGSKATLPAKPVEQVPSEEARRQVKEAGLERLIDLGDRKDIAKPALDIMMDHARRPWPDAGDAAHRRDTGQRRSELRRAEIHHRISRERVHAANCTDAGGQR
jgi:hypothetical protein